MDKLIILDHITEALHIYALPDDICIEDVKAFIKSKGHDPDACDHFFSENFRIIIH